MSPSPIREEPARGSYPDVGLLALPGRERTGLGAEAKIPPPPIHHLFGLRPVSHGPTGAVFSMPASPWLQTEPGVFLAGVSALVADAPLGSAIIRDLPAGMFGTTSQLSMSFQRAANVDSGELIARSSPVDVGTAVGLSEAIVEDGNGRLLALLTSRYYLARFDPLPPLPEVWIPELPAYDTPDPYLRPLERELDPTSLVNLSGLEAFQRAADGSLPPPPFAVLFGIEIRAASEGRLVATTVASEWFCSPARTVYGGVLAFLADFALTAAATTTVPAGSSVATLDLTLHYLRPVLPTGEELTMEGEVVHRGRSLIVARTEIRNAAGKPVVMGNGSLRVLQGRTWSDVALADAAAETEDA